MSDNLEKLVKLGNNHKPRKDGEIIRGRWAGKAVVVRKQHYDTIEAWQKASGMKKAEFWRQAVLRGALAIAQSMGIADKYPDLQD